MLPENAPHRIPTAFRSAPGPSWFGGLCELAAADAEYHNSDAFQQDRRYWTERFGDVPTPASLSGRRAPGGGTLRRGFFLSREVSAGLRELARSYETSLPRLLVTLISIYVYRLTGQEDLIIGFPVAARGEPSLRRIPG